ncbi:MAG TPA: GNAT family N-acetyltransferase [Luteibaculaceae bacterium]|nr:GNAT family N-acetyltransferase [Luteibaculaceae bacterium]
MIQLCGSIFPVFKECQRIEEVDAHTWNAIAGDQLLLRTPYLSSLEKGCTRYNRFRYVQWFNDNNEPIGIAYLQEIWFKGGHQKQQDELHFFARHIKDRMLGPEGVKVLLCGNAYVAGNNGFKFVDGIDFELQCEWIASWLREKIKTEDSTFTLAGIKDLWEDQHAAMPAIQQAHFHGFKIDPVMKMDIDPRWKSIADYTSTLQAKYRTKYNAARKKGADLVKKSLSVDEIKQYLPAITSLFNQVLDRSRYHLGTFEPMAFLTQKSALGEEFDFSIWLHEEQPVAFATSIFNGTTLEANHVGLDYQKSNAMALYSTLLYHYVDLAITHQMAHINFGRTADEIKSTVGAKPVHAYLFTRHKNSFSNQLIKPILSAIHPAKAQLHNPYLQEYRRSNGMP